MKTAMFNGIVIRVFIASIASALFACLTLSLVYLDQQIDQSRTALETQGEWLSGEVAAMSEFALVSGNMTYLDNLFRALAGQPGIDSIALLDSNGNNVLSRHYSSLPADAGHPKRMDFVSPVYRAIRGGELPGSDHNVEQDTDATEGGSTIRRQSIGSVKVTVSSQILNDTRLAVIRAGIVVVMIVLLASVVVWMVYSRMLVKPIRRLVDSVNAIRNGRYNNPVHLAGYGTLAELTNGIDRLAAELNASKKTISQTMLELAEAREQADRTNATRSLFLARVSHELREPITAVVGNLEILQKTQINEYQERAIRLAEKNTEFLLGQIDDLLEFSAWEAGQYATNYRYFKLAEIVDVVCKLTKPKAEKKRLSFDMNLDIDNELSGCYIESDPVRLQQILINLIDNAIKFTYHGSTDTLISLRRISPESNQAQLVIEVTDTGIGIAKEQLDHIFVLFKQDQLPASTEMHGVGLGLSITKCIVEAMGGGITVESELHKGSKFRASLEVNTARECPEPDDDPFTDNGEDGDRSEKILLVDNNLNNQRTLSTLLHNIGVSVDTANHGGEGLEKYRTNCYDLIFVDCFLPHLNGFEFTRSVREHESRYNPQSKTLTIGISAGMHSQNIENCYAAGMDDVITKPVYRTDIYKRVLGLKKAREMLDKVKKT